MTNNCEGCLNLRGGGCQYSFKNINQIWSDEDIFRFYEKPCIFKNTTYGDLSFSNLLLLSMTRIAVSTYYMIDDDRDLATLQSILAKEKDYGAENPIGEFNVIVKSRDSLNIDQVVELSNYLKEMNGKRLWSLQVLLENMSIDDFILDNCKLPFFMQIVEPEDFAVLQQFKFKCLSGELPAIYNDVIFSTAYMRSIKELSDANEEEGIV